MLVPFVLALTLAQAPPPKLIIGGASFQPYPLAVAPFTSAGEAGDVASEIYGTLKDDLAVSGLFDPQVLNPKGYLADPLEGMTAETIHFQRWSDVGAEGLVKGQVVRSASGTVADVRLFDVLARQSQLVKSYRIPAGGGREVAHRIADDLIQYFTNEPGPFESNVCVVKDIGRQKELFVAAWDDHGERQVTHGGQLNLLPSWAPDGHAIAFTSYKNGHPDIWELLYPSLREKLLAGRGDLNTGGEFSPDGRKVAFASSSEGNDQIYLLDLASGAVTRLTNDFGIDASPDWSPDGKQLAFVSQREGNPQIFVMNADGSGGKRLTFQGNYNQTPKWSPRGDLIAFTARDERAIFDLFTINVQSGQVTRLTQDQGLNSEPSWAPNGRLLVFTSTRTGKKELWVTTADGTVQHQLTHGGGYSTPSWGPSLARH
ncbi:MAG: Tol-Pal system beta propeller repeat protein TolB [Deltaproteobacteria bacterium]